MGRLRDTLGIRLIDVGATVLVALVVELNVTFGGGAGAHPLDAVAYVLGAILAIPILVRRKWPLQALIGCSVLLLIYYIWFRRNISPAPLLSLPLYDAALAGYLTVAIVIPASYMTIGLFVVGFSTHQGLAALANEFLPSIVVLALALMLGDTVRSRRALAAETADRLRLAEEEREAEAGRRVAEERLRIARELHDTVAHSMATITVQAGSALHLLGEPADGPPAGDALQSDALQSDALQSDALETDGPAGGQRGGVQAALIAIREISKSALSDIRVTLGQLRGTGGTGGDAAGLRPADLGTAGLDRLPKLSEAVQAAGAPVSVTIEGEQVPLDPSVDHAAYRILQESLTNVLRHAGPQASAMIRLRYAPEELTIEVTDDGGPCAGWPDGSAGSGNGSFAAEHPGHGITGMAERAAAVGGELTAGLGAAGGFTVRARLPVTATATASASRP